MDLLACPMCLFLMCEPVTVSCGHSFCRRCLDACLPSRCPACKDRFKHRDANGTKNNVLLLNIIQKCCPEQTKLTCHIRGKLKTCEFTEALRMADEGIQMAPADLSLKVWRVEANMGLHRFSDALQDLEDLCYARPNWTEGFFRKGNVLVEMGRKTEALLQFSHCLKLQEDFAPAKNQIKKILEAEGMDMPEEVPQVLHVVTEFLKEPRLSPDALGGVSPPALGQLALHNHLEDNVVPQTPPEVKQDPRSEYCLSLCQAVVFLPAPEDDEEPMMKEMNGQTRGSCGVDRACCFDVLTLADFECPLCIRLFYEPVTTPCGHTFCKTCIERSLDHNLHCPLCKQPLQEFFKNRKYQATVLLQDMARRLFSQQLEERKQVHDAEMSELSNLTKDVPIFVCTVAYPNIPCPLHVFEPRYRLMIRRCMDTGTRRFGMCTYEHGKGFADYGCMLEILDLDLLPDGRSYVDTVGGSRFRVLRRGHRDGYHTADVEYLEDHKTDGAELEVLQRLHDSVYQQACDWYVRLNSRIREQISQQYGDMPEREDHVQASPNGPAWCWWLLSVLQLDPAYQTTVLSLTSLRERLGHLRIVLEYFSQS
ncbi:LON peptidase N-terminal domain and RING finger protein 1 [Brachyhypopomus gauderio]|uniref:LON peptidase N-terminal domain and RING finger protein 1 n=1 Tax=Brachyhypopomus gauderio TaxID=698409 RepID=UPI004041600F